jgi:hypothetical protein
MRENTLQTSEEMTIISVTDIMEIGPPYGIIWNLTTNGYHIINKNNYRYKERSIY